MDENYIESKNFKVAKWSYRICALGIILGMILTIISWAHICSESCKPTHDYLIYGFSFETFGFIFFPLAALFHTLSLWNRFFSLLTALMLLSATGAEIQFIYLQKYVIGSWCVVCLSIAGTIFLSLMALIIEHISKNHSEQKSERGQIMRNLVKSVSGTLFIAAGFLFALLGIEKQNRLQAAENSVKESITFGDTKSSIEVYIFTDWACPACRALEPSLEKLVPKILKKAKMTFVDFDVHPETLNYTPYNLSFMIHNKSNYLSLRRALTDLSIKTGSPSDQQVEKLAISLGTKYKQLNYADVALGLKYYKHLATQFKVESTPTVAIINRNTKKGKKLIGTKEITDEKVLKAIETLSK